MKSKGPKMDPMKMDPMKMDPMKMDPMKMDPMKSKGPKMDYATVLVGLHSSGHSYICYIFTSVKTNIQNIHIMHQVEIVIYVVTILYSMHIYIYYITNHFRQKLLSMLN